MQTVLTGNVAPLDVSIGPHKKGVRIAHTKNAVKVSRGFPRESGQVWTVIWTPKKEWSIVI